MLEARNLGYAVGNKWLVKDVSYRFLPGKCYMLCGPNGAGKSTLMKLISLELSAKQGEVLYNGQPVVHNKKEQVAKQRAMLSQNVEISFPMTVEEIVLMGRYPHFNVHPSKADFSICEEVMNMLGITQFRKRNYLTLSGGEKQRVQFARVLVQIWEVPVNSYRYLLLDEPISSLDLKYQFDFLHQVKKFMNERTIVIAILHDLNLVLNYADEVLLMKDGMLFAGGLPHEVLHPGNIQQVFQVQSVLHRLPEADLLWVQNR